MTSVSSSHRPLYIISGPTASGKTHTAIDLAKRLQGLSLQAEIVNFDSIIFYKELNIGSAKPTLEERQDVTHHLIDVANVQTPLNASDYVDMAEKKIDQLHAKGIIPILTGGSAFYLRALIKGMYDSPKVSPEIKKELDELYSKQGIDPIIEYLQEHDPESLETLHSNDHYRLMRAYEHYRATKKKFSEQKKKYDNKNPYDFSEARREDWDIWHIYLDIPKEKHWDIINLRSHKMISDGLLDEVQLLLSQGISSNAKPLQSVGYKEVTQLLEGQFDNLDDCVERICISTRQLAKSQRTFFNKIMPKQRYNPLIDSQRLLKEACEFLKSHQQGTL
jgi:tRNA dimethylallyltransferase